MCRRKVKKQISLIVPFQTTDPARIRSWTWLKAYWEHNLHDVEIIECGDPKSKKSWHRRHPKPFSKTAAINRGVRKSHGDIIVIIDSDVLLDWLVIESLADRIRAAREVGVKLWFIPYLWNYRLNERFSEELLLNENPYHFDISSIPVPPPEQDVDQPEKSWYGHKWGAMIQFMPREAFTRVWADERFRGWGGEDSSLMHAIDTLYARHKNSPNAVFHIFHPRKRLEDPDPVIHVWGNQESTRANDWLGALYSGARYKPAQMQAILDTRKATQSLWNRLTRRPY